VNKIKNSSVFFDSVNGWWLGVVVMHFVKSTKLLYSGLG